MPKIVIRLRSGITLVLPITEEAKANELCRGFRELKDVVEKCWVVE